MENSLFVISLMFFFGGICFSIYCKKTKKFGYQQLGIFLFFSTTLALIPIYVLRHTGNGAIVPEGLLLAILDCLHAMTGKYIYEGIVHIPKNVDGINERIFLIYISVLYITILLLLIRIILSIVKDFYVRVKYFFSERGQLCVFSHVSPQTLALAQDIRNREKICGIKYTLVFINKKKNSTSADDSERLSDLQAYVFGSFIHDFILQKRFLRHDVHIFIFEEGDLNNVHTMLDFLRDSDKQNSVHKEHYALSADVVEQTEKTNKNNKKTPCIYMHILSAYHETELVLDSLEANNLTYSTKYGLYDYIRTSLFPTMRNRFFPAQEEGAHKEHPKLWSRVKIPINLRIVRENRSTFYNLFHSKPLFLGIKDNRLTVLIVGGGINGREALKIASWCGQTLHTKLELILVDSDMLAKKRLIRDCPELFVVDDDSCEHSSATRNDLTSAQRFSQKECTVYFYCRNVEETGFVDVLENHPTIGYAICTLGDDHRNLRAALHIRGFFEKAVSTTYTKRPFIAALLNDSLLVDTGDMLKFDTKINCWIYTFGGIKEIYTWDNIVSPYLSELGKHVNRFYYAHDKTEEADIKASHAAADVAYEQKEYYRTSSIATGLHIKYKIYAALCQQGAHRFFFETWNGYIPQGIVDHMKTYLLSADVTPLAQLEHRRWDTYTRSVGWRSVDMEQVESYKAVIGNYRNFAAKLQPCIVPWEDLPTLATKLGTDLQELDRGLVRHSVTFLESAMAAMPTKTLQKPLLASVGVTGRRTLGITYDAKKDKKVIKCAKQVECLLRAIRALFQNIVMENPHYFPVRPALRLCSCLSHGADRCVASEALKLNYMLDVALPFPPESTIHTDDIEQARDTELAHLLYKARDVLVFGEHVESEARQHTAAAEALRQNVYQEASQAMLDHCNVLIVLWDGTEDNNIGGTCENMRKAFDTGKLIFYIDSQGDKKEIQAKFKGYESDTFFEAKDIGDVWAEYVRCCKKNNAMMAEI